MWPAVECGWYTQCHSIDKTWFSLCQWLSTAFCLGVGFCTTSPPSCWDIICLELVQVLDMLSRSLCMSCVYHLPAVFAKHCFLEAIHHPWLLKSSPFLFPKRSLKPWWKCDIDTSCRDLDISSLSEIWPVVGFCVNTTCYKRKPFWW